jgi:hypothetical protein
MPYVSQAQQGFFHSPAGMAKVGPKIVAEFDDASRGQIGLPKVKKPETPTSHRSLNFGALVARARDLSR